MIISISPFLLLSCMGLCINFHSVFPQAFPALTVICFLGWITSRYVLAKSIKTVVILSISLLSIYIWNNLFLGDALFYKGTKLSGINFTPEPVNLSSITLKNKNGDLVSVANLHRNEYLLIDFISVNCAPCIKKLVPMDRLQDKAGDRLNIIVVVYGGYDSYESYLKFEEKFSRKFINLHFYYDVEGIFTKQFGLTAFPVEYLVNRQNQIILKSDGYDDRYPETYIDKRTGIIKGK